MVQITVTVDADSEAEACKWPKGQRWRYWETKEVEPEERKEARKGEEAAREKGGEQEGFQLNNPTIKRS